MHYRDVFAMNKPLPQTDAKRQLVEANLQQMTELMLNEKEDLLHVLYVDDEECLLRVSKRILEMDGEVNVDVATSVGEAFEMLKNQSYDAVISDYEMSGKIDCNFLENLEITETMFHL